MRQRGLQQNFCVRAKKTFLFTLGPRALSMSLGDPRGPRRQILGPWDPSKKILLATYLNGFTIVTSWTRLRKVRLTRVRHLRIVTVPSSGRKSLVTLRPPLGVKRSKKGLVSDCYTISSRVGHLPSETTGRRTLRFRILVKKGPLRTAPNHGALGPWRKKWPFNLKVSKGLVCMRQRGLQQNFV